MKLCAKIAIRLLPLLLLTSCAHKQPGTARPLAPPLGDAASKAPLPSVEHPPLDVTIPSLPLQDAHVPPPARKPRRVWRRAETPAKPSDPTEAKPSEQAANATAGVSAIGQLSSGDPSDLRRQSVEQIAGIERGLREIGHPLNDPEQKTAAQIREYMRQAKSALASGDVEGALTLAAKAKVLLGELSH